jgi:hypothetical protein
MCQARYLRFARMMVVFSDIPRDWFDRYEGVFVSLILKKLVLV